MSDLRPALKPGPRDPATVAALTTCIEQIVQALDAGSPTEALMETHNRLAARDDIGAERYLNLDASMSSGEAAEEALSPVPRVVTDISRDELDALAALIASPDNHSHTTYYLQLFKLNTPHGNSDLFFWPDPEWLRALGINEPTPSQIVDKALNG